MKCLCNKSNINNFKKKITGINVDKYSFSIYKCKDCNVGISRPFLSKKERERVHSIGPYRNTKGKRFNFIIEYLVNFFCIQRAKRILKYKNIGKILDVGSGSGLLLSILKSKGWMTVANEINSKTASVIKKNYGLSILQGDINSSKIKKNSFDVINISHVLEHMTDPFSVIKKCNNILKENGFIFVAIPNNNSLQSIIGKKHWYHLCLPYHLYHLTEKNLTSLLKRNNFEIKYIKHFDAEMNIFGWLQTILNMLGLKRDFLFSILDFNSLKKEKMSLSNLKFYMNFISSLMLSLIFLPISVLLSIVESIIKKGGCIEVCAKIKK